MAKRQKPIEPLPRTPEQWMKIRAMISKLPSNEENIKAARLIFSGRADLYIKRKELLQALKAVLQQKKKQQQN